MKKIKGNIVDIELSQIYFGELLVEEGVLVGKNKLGEVGVGGFVLPGLVDSHVHIESSMLVPQEFACLALRRGVVSVVADPHEIANVCGFRGVEYMFRNADVDWFKFYFGVPSCVPATRFETSGESLGFAEVGQLMGSEEVVSLAEVMNFPGVVNGDKDLLAKIDVALRCGKVVDGHAPGLVGADLKRYVAAGVGTDHECMSVGEAKEKIDAGMMVQIREGSAARNFDNLAPLFNGDVSKLMVCNDDAHPDDLLEGYMDERLKRGVALGYDLFDLLKVFVANPVDFYGLDVGKMRVGDKADFCVVDDLRGFNVQRTYVNGQLVYDGEVLVNPEPVEVINNFKASEVCVEDLDVELKDKLNVIDLQDGELYTVKFQFDVSKFAGAQNSIENDVLKLVVLNRYEEGVKPSVAYIRGFGFKTGAIASTVAHDSHNIVAVGTSDELLVKAINKVVGMKGGIVAVDTDVDEGIQLEVAGLMTRKSGVEVAQEYQKLNEIVKGFGSKLRAPYMSLSFMCLLVIPELKLSDKGLFDGTKFEFVDVTY